MTLYIFPHAGGSFFSYSNFQKHFPAHYKVKVLELPGRGKRFYQRLLTNIDELAELLYQQICHDLDKPYSFFGHSMGSLTGYLVIQRILKAGKPLPVKFFPSAGLGPNAIRNYKRFQLSSDALWSLVNKMGHVSAELLASEKLKKTYEAIFRADFQAYETYQHKKLPRFNVPITVFLPSEDDKEIEEYNSWQAETTLDIKCVEFEGGHFYFLQDTQIVADTIVKEIELTTSARI